MIRVVRVELLRSTAKSLAILLFGVFALSAAAMHRAWWAQWLVFTYVETTTLFLAVPLALAGGALIGRRDRRTGAAELVASTGRPRWQRVTPTMAATAVGVAAAHLLFLALAGTLVAVTGSYLGPAGIPTVLIDTALLVGAAWAGVAAGRAWASPLLPPMLAAAALAGQLGVDVVALPTANPSPWRNLNLVVQPAEFPWEDATWRALLGRLALGAGLALGGFLLVATRSWWYRGVGTAALAAGVAGLLLVTPSGQTNRYRVEPSAQRVVCADGAPEVCVTAVHAYALPGIVPDVRRALTALAKLPGAPTRAAEFRPGTAGTFSSNQFWTGKPTTEPGTVLFVLELAGTSRTDPDLTASIVFGAGTRWNGCAQDDEVAKAAAGAWLLGTDDLRIVEDGWEYPDDLRQEIRNTVRQLRALPETEQLRRVTALRDAANRCEPDLLRLLTGSEGAS
ncbi:hypothetical protein O7626_23565 [Micromonospora sp. WMMD1102]|uniref:hypothetical protein n=1 Tax=Micromonospora sp. WMMD1102 TaxID=3016105 RepID=UPI0024154CF0|nr:hypothetical protein [Micromonospora sp. WMMD1102]MDG4788867.1 hypothetical protein [Micromonospora sp. WMMD1102]